MDAITQAKPNLQTFADFLAYDNRTDGYYEWLNRSVKMTPPMQGQAWGTQESAEAA